MTQYQQALALLQKNPFQNLATLKHITLYNEHLDLDVEQNGDDWLVIAKFPSKLLAHDALLYPHSKWTLFISNSDSKLKFNYRNYLPDDNCVIKTYDNEIEKDIEKHFKTKKCRSLLSYSTDKSTTFENDDIFISGELTEEITALFTPYSLQELNSYFKAGGKWFGIKEKNNVVSGCFIFPNFNNIWEIAGVFTLPDFRRNGYAMAIVAKALDDILSLGNVPRYQVVSTNEASINLTQKIGMELRLTLDHFEIFTL
jgi:RimJ/RimL family protein N-acetyltransferase